MYRNLIIDWNHFTDGENRNLWAKLSRVRSNPGMKMVLLQRFINDTPKFLFPIKLISKIIYHKMMFKYGIDLPLNLKFGYNLRIYHFGGIVINPDTVIGNNVTIMHNVTIGNKIFDRECPVISDNVFIGVGAVVLGKVFLAKNMKVGANAVVTKSFEEENIVVVGVPAKKLYDTLKKSSINDK